MSIIFSSINIDPIAFNFKPSLMNAFDLLTLLINMRVFAAIANACTGIPNKSGLHATLS